MFCWEGGFARKTANNMRISMYTPAAAVNVSKDDLIVIGVELNWKEIEKIQIE